MRRDRVAMSGVRLRRALERRERYYETVLGTGAKTAYTIIHNLGTQDVATVVYDYDTDPFTEMSNGIDYTVDHSDVLGNEIIVNFAGAPALNAQVRIMVMA